MKIAQKRKALDVTLINVKEKEFKMAENLNTGEEGESETLVSKKGKNGVYTCQVCFVTYSNSRGLRRHIERFKDRKYPCRKCGTKFGTIQCLQSHIAFTHGAERFKNYKMKCPVCNQKMNGEAILRTHLCHVHSDWVATNFDQFVAESCATETETPYYTQYKKTSRWKRQMVIKFVKNFIRTTSNDDNETPSKTKKPSKNNNEKKGLSAASKVYRDEESLRLQYSCKACYVPLSRIDFSKVTPMKLVTPVKQRKQSPHKKSPYRADRCKSREKISPVKQLRRKLLGNEKEEKQNQLGLVNTEMNVDKIPGPDVFIKSECDNYENFEISIPVTEALEECIDPLDLGETTTETSSTFARYPTSFEFPVKIETPETTTENPEQCKETETSTGPLKAESMDCVDSPERIEATDGHPEIQGIPAQAQTLEYYYGDPSSDFTDASTEYIETFEPVKLEIEEHPISGYAECRSEAAAAEHQEIPEANYPMIETSSSSTLMPQKTQESCTMVASKICNKLFTSRRTMFRHFRKRHLSCFDDTVYCVCGKEMTGRRAMEKHFSRHCDRLIKTTRLTCDVKICKPLEKKYKCSKCGQRFWLPTCLEDHPPNCELPKPKPVNPCRLIKNVNRAYGLTSHLGEVGEYVCRICGVKFTSIDTLLRHLRSFSTNEKCPCVYCGTVFTGQRLLKGHVQSTHELNSTTTYTSFCEICNQGFTKKINHRIHTMHIHPKEMMKRVIEDPASYLSSMESVEPVAPNPPENQCNVCNLVFVNQKRFMDHVSYYDASNHYRCNICGQEFEGQYKAHHHRKKVHYGGKVNPSYTHYCELCKEGFMYKTHLHAHMFHVHDNEFNCVTSVKDYNLPKENGDSAEDLFECKQCPNKFRTVPLFLAHMDACHADERTKLSKVKCSHCDRQFSTIPDCINHVKHVHSTVPLSALDSIDPQGSSQPIHSSSTDPEVIDISISDDKLDSSVNPNAEEPQPVETDKANTQKSASEKEDIASNSSICFTCGFDCPGPWGLARHRALYLNSGIYSCEFCGRRFSWQTYYRDHKLKHFRRDVHNNYFCPVCDEGFDTITDLQMHAIHLHEEPLGALTAGPVPHTSRANTFRDEVTASNSTGDQPLTDTLGNDCEQKYGEVVQVQKKSRSILKNNLVVRSDTPVNPSSSSNRSPMCNICNMPFISNDMLMIHLENSHSLAKERSSTIPKPGTRDWVSMAGQKRLSNVGDRFYVLLGEKVHAQAVDSIGKKITMCNQNIGLTSKLYRYDTPLTCDVCNLTFQSKDMLYSHREFIHKIEKNFVFQSLSDDGKQSLPTKGVESLHSKSQGHVNKSNRVKVRSTATIPVLQSGSKQLQTVDQPSTRIYNKIDGATDDPAAHIKEVFYYKCGLCDIIFIDKHLMAVHEEKVHGLRTGDDYLSNEVTLQPLSSVIETQPVCVDNLWIGSKKESQPSVPPLTLCGRPSVSIVNPVTRTISPEEIMISDEETEGNNEPISTTTGSSFRENKESAPQVPLRLINLPPGNYKISKLKVRSTDMGKVMKLIKNTK